MQAAIRVLMFLAAAAIAFSQSFTSIDGRVTDPSGAAVSGAAVELTNVDTGLKRSTVAEGTGLFTFAQVTPGKYSLSSNPPLFSITPLPPPPLLTNPPPTFDHPP